MTKEEYLQVFRALPSYGKDWEEFLESLVETLLARDEELDQANKVISDLAQQLGK